MKVQGVLACRWRDGCPYAALQEDFGTSLWAANNRIYLFCEVDTQSNLTWDPRGALVLTLDQIQSETPQRSAEQPEQLKPLSF
jgi:hypothetical protein